ncbi:ROK family protein [Actinomycetes bacterium KLBMP 9759]
MARLAGSSRLLRAINERTSYALLLERGALTRGELVELTGLSKPTASEVIRRLQDAGLAKVAGHITGKPGPNAEIYEPDPDAGFYAAFSVRDLGRRQGPNLVGTLSDLTGTIRARTETRIAFGSTDPVEALAGVLDGLVAEAAIPVDRLRHVQLGVPGSYDPQSDTIRYVDVPGWSAQGLVGRLRERLAAPVDVANDVNLVAIAERAHGVAADSSAFALLWLGDEGLGLATDLGGTLLQGARGSAGEIGYMPVGLPGRGTGRTDYTQLVCGRAVLELAHEHGMRAGSAAAAVSAAAAGGHGAFLDELAERVAVGLAAVVAVLDPPLVVLAGEIGSAGGDVLAAAVSQAVGEVSPLGTQVAPTGITDDPVLLGAMHAGLTATRERLLSGLSEAADHLPGTSPERSPA